MISLPRPRPLSLLNLPGFAVAVFLAGCGDGVVLDDRWLVDLAPITARTNVIGVGDTVTYKAELGPADCLPAGVEPAEWRWSSDDPNIATIDPISGVALGVGPGYTPIRVAHAREPSVASSALLQVTGP